MSDPIREAVETWLSKYSPTDDFGCACTPQRTCGTCQWRERTDELRKAIAAPVQASVPEGWQLVPTEPTRAMANAGWNTGALFSDTRMIHDLTAAYCAMLAAAPRSTETGR